MRAYIFLVRSNEGSLSNNQHHEIMFHTNNPALTGSNFADIARLEALKQNNLKKVLIDKLLDAIFGENASENSYLKKEEFMGADWNEAD